MLSEVAKQVSACYISPHRATSSPDANPAMETRHQSSLVNG